MRGLRPRDGGLHPDRDGSAWRAFGTRAVSSVPHLSGLVPGHVSAQISVLFICRIGSSSSVSGFEE